MSPTTPTAPAPVLPKPHRFTADEYERMGEAGILDEDSRVELIGGQVVDIAPIGSRHAACVDRLTEIVGQKVLGGFLLRVQGPIRLDQFHEPQPDLCVLTDRDYSNAHPGPGDVLLLVEVSDSSLPFDRAVKLPLYAGANIPEVWLVDLEGQALERYTSPAAGAYTDVQRLTPGQRLASTTVPGVEVDVNAVLGPPA